MKKIKLLSMGLLPLIVGIISHLAIMNIGSAITMVYFAGLSVFVALYFFGRYARQLTNNPVEAVLLGNIFGIIAIIVLTFAILTSAILPNVGIGMYSQIYFLPEIGLLARLDFLHLIKHSTTFFYLCFVLMIGIFYFGYRHKQGRRKRV